MAEEQKVLKEDDLKPPVIPTMVDEQEEPADRIVKLKGNQKPPVDAFYYGSTLKPSGLVEVRLRTLRYGTGATEKFHDRVVWYERVIMVEGTARKLAYHVIHEPSPHELFADYFYPTTQYNISRRLLGEQDNVPGWKRMVAMQDDNTPFIVNGAQLRPYHYVVINRRYRPVEAPNGNKIDGVWVQSLPASGTYIENYRAAIKTLGGVEYGYDRQRVAAEQEIAIAQM